MSIEIKTEDGGKIVNVDLSGRLTREDYLQFLPIVEQLVSQRGKLRMLVEMRGFHGWTVGGLWEDLKFDVKHFKDIERIAFVGETKWQEGMASFCKPFTTATIQYFDQNQIGEARSWLSSELAKTA
ncbi:MAG: STAS/SEC14 domain-containing protein [Verrucomicrobiia bacterium]